MPTPKTLISTAPPPSPPHLPRNPQLHSTSILRPHQLFRSPKSSSKNAKIACQNAFSVPAALVRAAHRKVASSRPIRRFERLQSVSPRSVGTCYNLPSSGAGFISGRPPLRPTKPKSHVAQAKTSSELCYIQERQQRTMYANFDTVASGYLPGADAPVQPTIPNRILEPVRWMGG